MSAEQSNPVSYEDLAAIEDEFEEVDTEIMRKQYDLSASIFAKRSAVTAKIPSFWALVLEQAPPEIDQFVQPQDSRIFSESLLNIEVWRPELDVKGSGNPRSLGFRFEFQPNDFFDDTVLEKAFWARRAKDRSIGLVSEPVKIHWKEGKDLTEGLTDGAVALWEARKKIEDMSATGLPEYTALRKKVESWNEMNTSFFTWFGFVSGRRWVSAEESEQANEELAAAKAKRKAGQEVQTFPDEATIEAVQQAELDDQDVEVHKEGEELAVSIAEDLWPGAIKYFTQAQEVDLDMSDADFEEGSDDDADDAEEQLADIRALVRDSKGRGQDSLGSAGPPNKKQKK